MYTTATLNNTAHRILIIDDDEEDFYITSEYIKKIPGYSFVIEWSYDYKEAMKRISNKQYDLYMVDYYLGAKTGLDFINEAVKECDDPIILLTGKGNHMIDKEAMHAGAVDYLVKGDIDPEKLERSIRHSLQRSKVLKALRANEMKYRHIFENSLNAIFLTDEQLCFKDVNPATLKLLGYKKDELLNKSLYTFMPQAADKKMLQEKITSNENVKEEVELVSKSGNTLHCQLSFSKETDNEGQVYLQGIAHDISSLKREEKEKIHREKLDLADRISRTFAHEVRNPLNSIGLAADQLSVEFACDKAKVYIEIIDRNTKRIGEIILELLRGTPNIELADRNLQHIIDDSISAARDRMTLKKIKLITNYPSGAVTVKADFKKLKIAFLNIMINAIEAMQPDIGELTITLLQTDTNATVEIHDNGCGIKEENIPHLFEAYYTEKKSGLGLGLSSASNIVTLHEGKMEVISKLNEGTSFIITLPK
ncbi:MAG TPA: ATP-binding protein [Ferruginibacter sp.]|jgi:PAS domain S-box-containing protein|nr:ATP-binding protein [Ferruginibacter sp.]